MQLSVIILNYNVRYFLELCVLSVQKAIQNLDAEIIVIADPTVTTPTDAAYCKDASNATPLSVTASGGSGTFSYQWFSNSTNSNTGGTLVSGANNSSFLPPVTTVGTTYYYCVVSQTGANCEVSSACAKIEITDAPIFTAQPLANQTICLDGTPP